MSSEENDASLQQAAEIIARADALLVAAGAGMGVDSGLPDFRGNEGFWRAYPPFAKLGLQFHELANPLWFKRDPTLAWGFYGHRMNLYRTTAPHAGFDILRRWGERMRHGAFVFTSNVDGHFQLAGFDPLRVFEVHGTIHWMQCLGRCGVGLFETSRSVAERVDIDEETFRAREPLPACPDCGGATRPNILMFGDAGWDTDIAEQQERRLGEWVHGLGGTDRLVIVECGAGTAVPTVRHFSESLIRQRRSSSSTALIRINVREPQVPSGGLGLPLPALQALREIDGRIVGRLEGGPGGGRE